ncbi:MAG TPA: hypothetical protein IAB45_05275 [Candidatus Onthousia faecavium]|nr:hypothetical protein [Candidatus Onthousia faecavium]
MTYTYQELEQYANTAKEMLGFSTEKIVFEYSDVINRYLLLLDHYTNKTDDETFFNTETLSMINFSLNYCLGYAISDYFEENYQQKDSIKMAYEDSTFRTILQLSYDITNRFYASGYYSEGEYINGVLFQLAHSVYQVEHQNDNAKVKKYS